MSEIFDKPVVLEIPMEIPDSLYRLNDVMTNAGFEVYIAGGAVRDTILGKTPKDYDISTSASVQDVIKYLAPYVRFAEIQGEKSFEVARLIAYDENEYEFAPYRIDVGTRKGGGSTPAASIKEDVKRRDLTINALFYRIPSLAERRAGTIGEVVDYVGGIDDIKNEIIRTVGDPEERFKEDRLRILRAFRFAGRVGGEVEKEAADAIRKNNSLIEPSDAAVSDERIAIEIVKGIISAKVPGHYINMLVDFDLFSQILPGLKVSKAISSSRNIVVQLATILGENNSHDVARVIFDKKFGSKIKKSVKFLLDLSNINEETLIGLKKEYGRIAGSSNETLDDDAILDFGNVIGHDFNKFLNFAKAPPVVSARDLIAGGAKPGPEIGSAIREAEVQAYFGKGLDDSENIIEAKSINNLVKIAMIENPLNIPIPNLSGEVYIFDMDDTLFWAPEWHTIINTDDEGNAVSVDMEYPNLFSKAISFIEMINENHEDFIKKGKKGRDIPELISSYREEVGMLRLIKEVVDLPSLGKERQVVFVLSNSAGEPVDISLLKKYLPSKHLKNFDLRGKYVEGKAVIAGDAFFYQSPKTLGHIVNEEILNIYNKHSNNAIILTARETMDGMQDGIRDRMASVGAKEPISIFTKPSNISSGKYKAHVIGQIAQQEMVKSIQFYDDNLKYITDVNNILENVYGSDVHSKVNIHQVSVSNKPEEALFAKLSRNKEIIMLKKLMKTANLLDGRGLVREADYLDCLITKIATEEDQFHWTPELKDKWRQMMDHDERMAQHADRQREQDRQRAREPSSENVDALDYLSQSLEGNSLSQLNEQYSFVSWHLNDFITGLANIANKPTTPWQDLIANSDTGLYEDDPDKFIDEVVLYLTNFSSEFFLSRLGYGTEQNVLEPIDWTEFDRSAAQRYLTIHPDADPSGYGEPGNFGPHPGRSSEYDNVFPQLASELSSFILELFEIDISNPSHEEDLYNLLIGEGDQPNIFRMKSLVDRLAQITKPFDSEEVWDGGHYRGIRYFNQNREEEGL